MLKGIPKILSPELLKVLCEMGHLSLIHISIQRLQGSMKEVERGNFDNAAIQVWDDNEIGSLSRSFNIMTEEIQKLMKQSEREQRAKRKYELRVLQSQISPHFLYNTCLLYTSKVHKGRSFL